MEGVMDMEESKTNKGKEILTILLLTMVIATGTFAWMVWSSKDNTKMNVTIGELADVSFKTGSDINIGNLSPSFYYDDGALTEFTIRRKNGLTTTLNTSIYLDITSIDDELKNDSFKYVLLSSTDGNTYNEVANGSFKDASVGKLSVVTDSPLADNKTYYKFYIWIDGNNENNETMQGKSLKGTLNVEVSTPPANFVETLDDGSTGDSGSGVYKVTHNAIPASSSATGSEIPAVTDYRYYGPNPNNYICLDNSGGTCEDRHLYRIIGSIYEEKSGQNLIKVIKATPLTDGTTSAFNWNYENEGIHNNVWSTTTSGTSSGSTPMKILNGIWLTRGSASYNAGIAITINFTNYGPSDKAQSLINTTSRYYLGGYLDGSVKTPDIYLVERGTTTSSGNSKYWDGKIALMYLSDYGYAAGNMCVTGTELYAYDGGCRDKDWLYRANSGEWIITTAVSDGSSVWYVNDGNADYFTDSATSSYGLRPTFYLTSSTSIDGGDGSLNNPYTLK